MFKRRFKRRVAVHRGESLYYAAPAAVAHLLDAGLAVVRQRTARVISSVELTNSAVGYRQGRIPAEQLGLHPGSFGIRIETFDTGGACFAHRNPWHEVAAQ